MNTLTRSSAALALFFLAACGVPRTEAKHPEGASDVTSPLTAAFHEEMGGDQAHAVDLYLKALDTAAHSPAHPASVSVMLAALDALVHRDVLAFSDTTSGSALVDRVPETKLKGSIDARLAGIEAGAEGPFARALIARARLTLAERRGDASAAAQMRSETGCTREASLVGPVGWMTVSGVHEPPRLAASASFPAEVPGPGPFLPTLKPRPVAAFGCHVPLYADTSILGVREIAVDVEVHGGPIGLGVSTNAAAVVRAGGEVAIERAHDLGARHTPRFARLDTSPGLLRVIVKVGFDQDYSSLEIGAWDANGRPLRMHAPKAGDVAGATVRKVTPVLTPDPSSDGDAIAIALGDLAGGDTPGAENLLASRVAQTDVPPDLLLVYARAVRGARDLPSVKSQERARSAYDRVLETMPSAWEAVIEHASLAGARRGRAEANVEALNDLDTVRAKAKLSPSTMPLLDAYEAQTAGREGLFDRANAAFDRIKSPLAGTSLLADTDRAVVERTGRDLAAFDCSPQSGDRTSLACHSALENVGDRVAAERELERLRALGGTQQLYLSLSTRQALETGDLARASKLLDEMNPGDRPLSSIYAVKGKSSARDLLALAPAARDAPIAIASILRDAGDDPLAPFDGVAEKAVTDQASGNLANAATAVLAHRERYDIDANGLIHYVMLDVRRVMGTTDVESNAQANAPQMYGRDAVRVLRRRIFKKDGRIVLPDPTPRAAQSHADLSQLEAGDAIEAVYEGWGLPSETGTIGVDTPDLLPERTAVHDATIEMRIASSVKPAMWAHPLLGSPEEHVEGNKHVYRWHMKDRSVRRVEGGVAKMDRNVGVSLSTTTWNDLARGVQETIASLEAPSPEVTQWAREAAGDLADKPSRALVEKIVAASGTAVKESNGIVLSDIDLGRAGNHGMTARNILVTHEGSRTWLIVHALWELGVDANIAIAENEPFSSTPYFPPHFGRFMHPLAVAHLPEGDLWIDADVSGPPLPAGKISPELRGRSMLWPDGKITPVPSVGAESQRSEVDIRLAVDAQGDAKGTITVLLHGEDAQELSEALVRLVGVERQRALRGVALGWVPFATVDRVELSSREGSWEVAVRADLTAPAYAQMEGTKPETRLWDLPGIDPIHYVFPRPFVTTLSSTYASQSSRESALAINRATQYHVRRRVDLPPKASIARLPGPFDEKGPLLSASRKISVNGPSIEEDFTLDVTTGTVPQERYEQFVSAAHHADDAFRASTRVKPPLNATAP